MKRTFTFLFAVLFTCVGVVKAELVEGKAYNLKVSGANTYLDAKTAIADNQSKSTIGISNAPVTTYLKKNDNGTWKIYVNQDGTGFLGVDSWCATPNQETGADWTIEDVGDDNYCLSQSVHNPEGRKYLGGDDFSAGKKVYTDQSIDKAIKIQFVDAVATVKVTYTFTYNDEVKYTQEATVAVGAEFPDITTVFPMGVVASKPAGVVSEENVNQTIALSIDNSLLPFVPAEDYKSIEHWYYMNIREDGPTYACYDASINYIKATENAIDKNNKDAYSWAFIGNPIDGFSLVNRAAGATMVLSAPVAPTGNANESELARLVEKNGATGNLVWTILTPTHEGAKAGSFYVKHPTTSYAFNRQDYKGANVLCFWTGRDLGSALQVVERPMGPAAELEALIGEAEELLAKVNGNIGTVMGEYSQATATALSAAIAAANGVGEDDATQDDVKTLQAAIDAVSIILPIADKYYQFHSSLAAFAEKQNNAVKAAYSNGGTASWKTLDNDDKSFYWKAVATQDGAIVLKNANDGKYLTGNSEKSGEWTMADVYSDAAKLDLVIFSKEGAKGYEYGIVMNGYQMHTSGHSNGDGIGSTLVSWNTDQANTASSWYIVEVEMEEFCDVVYNYKYNNETKYSYTVSVKAGAEYPELPNMVLPYGVTSDAVKPEGAVANNVTIDFNLTIEKELPFKAADKVENIDTWYYAQMHANSAVTAYLQDDSNEKNQIDWNDRSVAQSEIESHLWGYVGDVWTGIKVVNKGTGRAVVSTNGAAILGDPTMATAFIPTNSQAGAGWFCLKYPGNANYLNAQGNQEEGAGYVNSWNENDNGSSIKLAEYEENPVAISDLGYTTLYLNYPVYIPQGVEAYIVSEVSSENVLLTLVANEANVIPEKTAVILKNKGDYTFATAGVGSNVSPVESKLYGVSEDTEVSSITGGVVFTLQEEKGSMAFKKCAEEKLLSGSVYIVVSGVADDAVFSLEKEVSTSIATINTAAELVIYDLSGRRVEKMEKGIYIVNGVKVIKK